MFNARYDFPCFLRLCLCFFLQIRNPHMFVSGSGSYLCSISRVRRFDYGFPLRYYVILFLYIVILNGGKGVTLLGESFFFDT